MSSEKRKIIGATVGTPIKPQAVIDKAGIEEALSFKVEEGEIWISYDGGDTFTSLGEVSSGVGSAGITPEFKVENGEISVSYDGGDSWTYLDNIRGADGEDGEDGKDGADGITPTFKVENGEIFVSYDGGDTWSPLGNVKGEDGKDGTSVTILGSFDSTSNLPMENNTVGDSYLINGNIHIWDGEKWVDGGNIQGPSGKDGDKITSAYVNTDGQLMLELSSGDTFNAGKVTGASGNDGEDGITPTFKVDNGEILVSYNDGGTWTSLGKIQGEDGEDGEDGITPTFKIEYGNLFVSYNGGRTWNTLDYIQGADGSDGTDGISPILSLIDGKLNVSYNKGATWAELGLIEVSVGDGSSSNNGVSSRMCEVTLSESKWDEVDGSDNLYSQVVGIEGVTVNTKVDLTPSAQQLVDFYDDDIAFVTENDVGKITVYCIGQKPEVEYTIQAILTEVDRASAGDDQGSDGNPVRIGEVVLLASAWDGSNNFYSQVVEIEGVTDNTKVDITLSATQLVEFYEKDLAFVTENYDGVVTVYCIGQKPLKNHTIQVTLTEVE